MKADEFTYDWNNLTKKQKYWFLYIAFLIYLVLLIGIYKGI